MFTTTVAIFVLTYLGVALGRVPGLTLDRTGIALLGAIGMILCEAVPHAKVLESIDFSTILLLYSLMIISAQLRLGGFYTWTILKITLYLTTPKFFLGVTMLLCAILSALLANDIICLAFTPVLTLSLLKLKWNPTPFLLGLAISSNIGSASTIIGNPQNMLIGQLGQLDFVQFFLWCAPPTLLSLGISYGLLCRIYRHEFMQKYILPIDETLAEKWPEFNLLQSIKGIIATLLLVILFLTSVPRELSAIGIAGALLCSRKMKSRQILELIDWHLITLFCSLFVVIQAIENVQLPQMLVAMLGEYHIQINAPFTLVGVSVVLSNLVSNVPATMLLTQFLDPSQPTQWYILAVSSTFAGNFILIGSIANLIVVEQAAQYGVVVTFRQHARVGIPATLLSLGVCLGWLLL